MSVLPLPVAATAALERVPSRAPTLPTKVASPAEAQRVGRDFEAMFLTQMLAPMFEGLHSDGLFGGGHGEKLFRSQQIDAYARGIAARGGIGLSTQIARQILTLQENANG